MNRVIWRRPIAGLTAKQAAATPAYAEARRKGAGIVAAIQSVRWSHASRTQLMESARAYKKRSAAAKRGWKARRQAERV